MIRPSYFYDLLIKNGTDFFAGVPDSLLKNICAFKYLLIEHLIEQNICWEPTMLWVPLWEKESSPSENARAPWKTNVGIKN